MAWTGQSFSVGQILTAAQMTNLQSDITAAFNKDSGAPVLANSYIVQAMLSTSSGTVTQVGAGASNPTLPGGQYGFYPQIIRSTASGDGDAQLALNISDTSYVTNIYINSGTTGNTTARQRYIDASPPYDMGDGEILLFIFLNLEQGTGRVVGAYVAPTAPWHYNGPTRISADLYRDGKCYQRIKDLSKIIDLKDEKVITNEYEALLKEAPIIEREVTQEIKNADMNLIPHPFMGDNYGADKNRIQTIPILLDPVSPLIASLAEISNQDIGEITKLIENGYLRFGNEALSRSGPKGVDIVSVSMRNTLS